MKAMKDVISAQMNMNMKMAATVTSITPPIMRSEWSELCSALTLTIDYISIAGYGSYSVFIPLALSSSRVPWRIKDGFLPHSHLVSFAAMSSNGFCGRFRPVVHHASDSIPRRLYRTTTSPQTCILDS